jgi:hypothetical protein
LTAFSKILIAQEQGREKGLLPKFAVVTIVLTIIAIALIAAIVAITAIAAFPIPSKKKSVPPNA